MEKIVCKLETPADANGRRIDVDLLTSTDAVYLPDGSMTLTEKLSALGIHISVEKPELPCVWAKVLRVEPTTTTE